jgi:two-component system, cell cycle sensor histidine kinase and response regulator CckA
MPDTPQNIRPSESSAVPETGENAIVITDPQGFILWVNRAFTVLTGYSSEEVMGQTPSLLKSGKHDRKFYQDLWATILAGQTWHGNLINRRKDGSLYEERHTINPMRSKEGVITHFIAIVSDVFERQQAQQQLLWRTAPGGCQ